MLDRNSRSRYVCVYIIISKHMYLSRDTFWRLLHQCVWKQLLSCSFHSSSFSIFMIQSRVDFVPISRPWNFARKELAKYMSNASFVSADICRGTYAFHALEGCGQALRGTRKDLHHHSFQTPRIQQFWSHSWHGRKWMKFFTASLFWRFFVVVFFVLFEICRP